ncbi:MAG: hypothetical protein R2711_06145 [Acidimicrobiales bacterium]
MTSRSRRWEARTAQHLADGLGEMPGAVMKLSQLVSYRRPRPRAPPGIARGPREDAPHGGRAGHG